MANAYREGFNEGLMGFDESGNPYDQESQENQYYDWLAGHREGEEEYNRRAEAQ